MTNFKEYQDREVLMDAVAFDVSEELKSLLTIKDRVTLAVPGGSTPQPFFYKLSSIRLDWSRVLVIPTDERFVPETSALSNTGLIKTALLQNFAKEAKILSFCKPNFSIQELAFNISDELKTLLPLDICILGMGLDMHTASIFPDADRLNDALDLKTPDVLIPIKSPSISEMRLTLTARVLRNALRRHLLITGLDKKASLDFALQSKEGWNLAPVRAVLFSDTDLKIHYAN